MLDKLASGVWLFHGSHQKSGLNGRQSRRFYHFCLKALRMPTGTVKWFNPQKGFGFIQPDNGGPDAFVHISAVERAGMSDLREGAKVSFELVPDRRSGKVSADQLKLIG